VAVFLFVLFAAVRLVVMALSVVRRDAPFLVARGASRQRSARRLKSYAAIDQYC
jgi:hypothetical protein